MEDHRVPPHGNSYGVVPISQAICADKKPLGLRSDPYGKEHEEIDEVAEVGKEVMVAPFVVSIVSKRHEIAELRREPVEEPIRTGSNQISADEDVQDPRDERHLLACSNSLGVIPPCPQPVD